MVMQEERTHLQGDPSGWLKPPFDLVPTVLAAGGPLLLLPTAQAGWQNIPNPSQLEVLTILMGHPVYITYTLSSFSGWTRCLEKNGAFL